MRTHSARTRCGCSRSCLRSRCCCSRRSFPRRWVLPMLAARKPVAYGIRALAAVLHPLVLASEAISRSLRSDKTGPVTSLDEIRLLATIGHSQGVVGEQTAEMIVGASKLRKLSASERDGAAEGCRLPVARGHGPKGDGSDQRIRIQPVSVHVRQAISTRSSGVVFAKEILAQLVDSAPSTVELATACA